MDVVVLATLLIFTLVSARRGLLRSIADLLIVVVALVGAGVVAPALEEPVSQAVMPLISQHIEQRVDDALAAQPPAAAGEEPEESELIADLLSLLGLDSDVRESLAQRAQEKIRSAGLTIARAVEESLAHSLIYAGLYILSFVLFMIVLKLLVRALDLVLRLPGLHLLNTVGGGIAGLVEGGLLLFLGIWVLRRFGVSFETDLVANTHILHFFTTNTPLSVLSFLL